MMGSAGAASASFSSIRGAGPNDRIRIGVVGLRSRGSRHISYYSEIPNVEVAALCDVDESDLDRRMAEVEKKSGRKPGRFTDIRKMLEDRNLDAVSIATPHHHHALQTIWSLQAGKHVFCEKPCTHNIFESKQIVAATRKYGKIVQHGVQMRSGGPREAVEKMRQGLIGDVYLARGLCFKRRDMIGRARPEPPPPGVHYDLWLGPAPKTEFTRNRFHYNWHWFWDYGNGDFGNQGTHELDIARWGLGVTYPTKVMAVGAHFMFDDDQETPNTLNVAFEFNEGGKKKMLVMDVRHWDSHAETAREGGPDKEWPWPNTVGNTFFGSNGYLGVDGYDKYTSYIGSFSGEPLPGPGAGVRRDRKIVPGPARGNFEGDVLAQRHHQNFIDAVAANKRELLNNEIEEGAITCTLLHLGNISYRLGRSIHFDPVKLEIVGDPEATAMMTRNYRAPFVVPAKV